MNKTFNISRYILAIIMVLMPFGLSAQSKLTLKDIDKIIIVDAIGGFNTTCAVERTDNGWRSVQTGQHEHFGGLITLGEKRPEDINSTQRILIRNIGDSTVKKLVDALNNSQHKLEPRQLGVTAQMLRSNIKANAYATGVDIDLVKKAITTERIDTAIIACEQPPRIMDAWAQVDIMLVKKQGDTIKLSADGLMHYITRWVLNKSDTLYNPDISRFCAESIGNNKYSNLSRLKTDELISYVYDYLYQRYSRDLITMEYYETRFRFEFAYLKTQYELKQINVSDILNAQNPLLFVTAHPKTLPGNILVRLVLYIDNADSLKKAVVFNKRVMEFYKQDNFIKQYITRTPLASLTYECPPGVNTFDYTQERFPYLTKYRKDEVVQIVIADATPDHVRSVWYILPDGNFALTYFDFNRGSKVLDYSIKKFPGGFLGICVVFDKDGKIISEAGQ